MSGNGRITPGLRAVLRALGNGWTLLGRTQRGHLRFRHGGTGALLVASESEEPRAIKNIQADARRLVERGTVK